MIFNKIRYGRHNYNAICFFTVPPHQLLIYDNSGRELSTQIGPLEEKTDLVLTCEVRGGKIQYKLFLFTLNL